MDEINQAVITAIISCFFFFREHDLWSEHANGEQTKPLSKTRVRLTKPPIRLVHIGTPFFAFFEGGFFGNKMRVPFLCVPLLHSCIFLDYLWACEFDGFSINVIKFRVPKTFSPKRGSAIGQWEWKEMRNYLRLLIFFFKSSLLVIMK